MPKHDDPAAIEGEDDGSPLVAMAAETLRGDTRDTILAFFKAQPKAWPFMTEEERRDMAEAVDRFSYTLIKEACQIIAARERPSIIGKLEQYTEKDGVNAKLKFGSSEEVITSLHGACGQDVLLVTSAFDQFKGERDTADSHVPPDQPALPIGDEYRDQ